MIVLDIETSGLNPEKHGIWQIGAIDFQNPENIFLEESRIDDNDEIEPGALKITGKMESELREENRQSQKEILKRFFAWASSVKIKNCICQNPQFDLGFILLKARRHGLIIPLPYRTFDLHTISQIKYYQINGSLLIKNDHSEMGLVGTLAFCGIPDQRMQLNKKSKIIKEGHSHNALEDAKLTAECFSRLVYGKNLFEEFSEFKIPEYLKK